MQRYGSTALDASLLLLPLLRFLPPEDPRIRATVLAIADELTHEGLVLRYKVDETDDGLRGEEGTFTICSFWLVSALVEIGEVDRARRCANGCCRWPARWSCTPRSSIRTRAGTSGTSPRRSPTWPWSTPSCTSSGPRRPSRCRLTVHGSMAATAWIRAATGL